MALNKITIDHIKDHIDYPATGEEIIKACDEWSDVPEDDRMLGKDKLDPDMTYDNAEEVLEAIGESKGGGMGMGGEETDKDENMM